MKNNKYIMKIANIIVNLRYLFLIIFILLVIICSLNRNNLKVNYGITSYLPEQTETKKGLELMKNEFGNLNEIQLLITNISYEDALIKLDNISKINHVTKILFNNTDDYYKNHNALFIILLDEINNLDKQNIQKEIIKIVKNDQYYLYVENSKSVVNDQLLIPILMVILITLVVLIISHSYFDIVIAYIIFSISIILNIGSNFILGEISHISKEIANVVQLGLSINYLIIFLNHYHKEIDDTSNKILAIKKTVSKSIKEIFSCSMTTIAIFMSLVFMQLSIGRDIGIVMSKGILCSMLTTVLVLPSILIIFNKIILKLRHRNFIPDTTKISQIIITSRKIVLPIFLILIILSTALISKQDFIYNESAVKFYTLNAKQKTLNKIENIFDKNNRLILIVKNNKKDYNKELNIAQKLLQDKKILSVTNMGNTKIDENLYLGSIINYQALASFLNIDLDTSENIYQKYAKENNEMIKLNDIDNYHISIINIIYFLYEKQTELLLSDEVKEEINNYYNKINESIDLLESDKYSRFIIEYKGEKESNNTFKLIDMIKEDAQKEYNNVTIVGESISSRDLKTTFNSDNLKISLLTILLIIIILLLISKSIGMTALLIIIIEGSILINFGFATIIHKKIFFISYIIVSIIQTVATINNAIVMYNRYQELRKKMKRLNAIQRAFKDSLPKIITGGLILTIASFLIAYISDSEIISSIGMFLGIGIMISMLSTIFILPSILYTFDRFIKITTIKQK